MKYTGFPLRYQFSVVELKRGRAEPRDVTQVINYSKWVAGRLANTEIETVQPILVAFEFDEETITKAKNSDFSERGILFFKYKVENNDLKFERVSI